MYVTHNVTVSPGQIASLRAALNAGRGLTLRIGVGHVTDGRRLPLMLTKRQIEHLNKARRAGHGADLKLSKTQIAAMKKDGGIIPLLAAIPGLIAAAAPTVLGALGTGALSGAAGYGVKKALEAASGKGLRLGPPRRGAGMKKKH